MLSSQEKRALRAIEQQLELSDPRLADSLRRMRKPRRPLIWPTLIAWLSLLAAAVAGWWIVALVILGPLLGLALARLADTGRSDASDPPGGDA